FSLDLALWGKNRAASRAAKAEAQSARYEFDEARLAITTGIASAYAELASLYAQRDSLEDALEIRTKSATLVKQRVDIGLDTQAEFPQATARVAQARADIEATDEAIELTKNALAELVGAGPDRALSIGRPAVALLQAQSIPADASTNLGGGRSGGAPAPAAEHPRRCFDEPSRPPAGHRSAPLASGSGGPADKGRARF